MTGIIERQLNQMAIGNDTSIESSLEEEQRGFDGGDNEMDSLHIFSVFIMIFLIMTGQDHVRDSVILEFWGLRRGPRR